MLIQLLAPAVINGLLTGGVYALVALGLTLIYGVLHIVNFAHGSLLMLSMYAAWLLVVWGGLDPYASLPVVAAAMFAVGWALYRFVIDRVSRGEDRAILLTTLGIAVILNNLALIIFTGDSRTVETSYSFSTVEAGDLLISVPRLISFGFSLLLATALWSFMALSETGRAIRAVAREPEGARLMGIRPERMFALAYGIGIACVGAAACLLLPTFYVSPQVGDGFTLVAFTIVVLGGMGSFPGAMIGGLLIGVTESLCGLFFGEQLGQLGVSAVFVAVLLIRPNGLLGTAAR